MFLNNFLIFNKIKYKYFKKYLYLVLTKSSSNV